jgi:multidrug efflux pump subunit AcrA (membrane-fusion protein)
VPEGDFPAVAPGTTVRVRVLGTGQTLTARIARRSPAADPSTRTIHFEIDVADPGRHLPVNTTAELSLEVGAPVPATEIPLSACNVRGDKATVMVVQDGAARRKTVEVKGEGQGTLYVDESLPAGTAVVAEGRAGLKDGDPVTATPAPAPRTGGARAEAGVSQP